jgi:hypothetical protein
MGIELGGTFEFSMTHDSQAAIWDTVALVRANDLTFSRCNCRLLPPRQFSKCAQNNEVHRWGCGVETYNLYSRWNNLVGKRALLQIARFSST